MERLLAEARAVNAIRHRGIIDIFSFGETPDGRQYFVMEFLDGHARSTLHRREGGAGAAARRSAIFEEILAALAPRTTRAWSTAISSRSNIFLVHQQAAAART